MSNLDFFFQTLNLKNGHSDGFKFVGNSIYAQNKIATMGKKRYASIGADCSFDMFEYPMSSNQNNEIFVFEHEIKGIAFNMIFCMSGTFTAGYKGYPDNPLHEEKITHPFLLGETEITQELYQIVMNDNPSNSENAENPVERVSWYDAIQFCNTLSSLYGLNVYYKIGDAKPFRDVFDDIEYHYPISINQYANGFRLPTKEEWEYAARTKMQNIWSGTNNHKEVTDYVWYFDNAKYEYWDRFSFRNKTDVKTQIVKQKNPNAWGFYDMSGNVWEWCWDMEKSEKKEKWWGKRLSYGGAYNSRIEECNTFVPLAHTPDTRQHNIGFRVARFL
jgi:sulfatase modifying factor 1